MCAYIWESLPVRNFTNSYLSECLNLELTINNKSATLLRYIDLLVKPLMNFTQDIFYTIPQAALNLFWSTN